MDLEKKIALGKEIGLEGADLRDFINQEQKCARQEKEKECVRQERVEARELKKLELQAQQVKAQAEAQQAAALAQAQAETEAEKMRAQKKIELARIAVEEKLEEGGDKVTSVRK